MPQWKVTGATAQVSNTVIHLETPILLALELRNANENQCHRSRPFGLLLGLYHQAYPFLRPIEVDQRAPGHIPEKLDMVQTVRSRFSLDLTDARADIRSLYC